VFWPVPNVDSGLVAFTRRDPPSVAAVPAARDGTRPGGTPLEGTPADGTAPGSIVLPGGTAPDGIAPAVAGEPDRAEVFAVIDAAFAQRRKTLRAALAPWAGSAAAAGQILAAAGLDPGLRGEALGVSEFARIALAARS
jgi:16S rRNA (adenine1518-N6/adenine1519-N6)-dimethyltransferase